MRNSDEQHAKELERLHHNYNNQINDLRAQHKNAMDNLRDQLEREKKIAIVDLPTFFHLMNLGTLIQLIIGETPTRDLSSQD